MEKIDLTKCNNLRYKAKIDGNDDYGRICVENADTGLAFLRSDREDCYIATWHCDCPGVEGYCGRKVTDFEIVPRDPETYQDWQVGDKIIRNANVGTVIFRYGEVVLYKYEETDGSRCCTCPYTCEELFRDGCRLVLTDIEKQIIEEKKKYEPQDGDVVYAKVRHNDNDAIFIYKRAVENRIYGYAGYNIKFDRMVDTSGFAYITPKILGDLIEYRPATDEEKQQLFDAMAKAGKRWNAEKKVVESIQEPEELRAGKSEIKSDSTHQFKTGEPVLVRDSSNDIWKLKAFVEVNEDSRYPYRVKNGALRGMYRRCIPYNERTMHLLGTTEDYKEEQL